MKQDRANRWNRRKARQDGNHSQCGAVGDNRRFSGKGGQNGKPDDRPHRNRYNALRVEGGTW